MATGTMIDLHEVREELQLLTEKVNAMEDTKIPAKAPGRDRSAQLSEVTRNLLYLQHLCRRVENAVMDQYWLARGHDDHL